MPLRAANATPYILTGLLTCSRCGHGFIGTRASGKTAVYRYYTCYCRQRNGSAKCDQERIPADRLEEAILTVTIDALKDRSIFEEAARKALVAWTNAHPSRESELVRLDSDVAEKRRAVARYLRAFEKGRMPESSAGDRLRELEHEIGALEAEKAVIEAELQKSPNRSHESRTRSAEGSHTSSSRAFRTRTRERTPRGHHRRDRCRIPQVDHAVLRFARCSYAFTFADDLRPQ